MEGGGLKNLMCCVHCSTLVNEVYVQYSPGNIRLTKCVECKRVADEYVECEMMIVLIDLILHKSEAYRHLFFNYPNSNRLDTKELIWKTSLLFVLLDSCKQSLLGAGKVDAVKLDSLSVFLLTAGKLMALVIVGNLLFLATILIASLFLVQTDSYSRTRRWTDILLALLLSSYFKLFTFAMTVWDFSPFMIHIIEMFVLSSNTVALKVMMNTTTPTAVAIIAAGALSRFFVGTLLWFCR